MRLSSQREVAAQQLTWRRRLRNGGGGSNEMTMQKQRQCRDDDDENNGSGKSWEQRGKGSRRQREGDVVAPSGAGRRKARQEVGAAEGCGVGFSVDYYLQVCPLTPF